MEDQNTARGTLQAFCQAWFEQRNAKAAHEFLTEDAHFVGTGENERAYGSGEMEKYLTQDVEEIPEPFTAALFFVHEQEIAENTRNLAVEITLKNTVYTWRLRGIFTMVLRECRWKISSLYFAEPGASQRGGEHYPRALVMENIARQRQELLNDSLSGGMKGGYIEEGFPFYFINNRMLQYLGYEKEEDFVEEINGMLSQGIHPDDRDMVALEVSRQLAAKGEYVVEYRMKKRDGTYIWVHDLGRETVAENGKRAVASVCIDITENRRVQERSRDLYEKELIYFTQAASFEGSIQGRINVTQNCVEGYYSAPNVAIVQVGDTYENTIENLAAAAVNPADGRRILESLERTSVLEEFADGRIDYHFEFLRRRRDCGVFWSNTSFRFYINPDNGDLIAFFYTLDITEQKLQEQLLEKITKLDYDIIVEIDLVNGQYRLVGHADNWKPTVPCEGAFEEQIYRASQNCIGEKAKREFLEKLQLEYIKERLSKQYSYTFLVEFMDDRGPRVKKFQLLYISEEMGRVCMTQADMTDVLIQEQQQKEALEAALSAAEQANAAKTDFLSRMSHDIRTPMNAIMGMTTLANANIDDTGRVSDCLQKISASSRHLLSLINDILDMSKIERAKVTLNCVPFSVAELVDQAASIMSSQARAAGLSFHIQMDEFRHPYIYGDTLRISQILINILGNAVKFTPKGGVILFKIEEFSVEGDKQKAGYRFTVSDTGIGIPEEALTHLFEPFVRSDALWQIEGTGLGLSIVKGLVDLMGGRIFVQSQVGKGSVFQVELECGIAADKAAGPEGADEENMSPTPEGQSFSGCRFLVAEDNAINAEIISEFLQMLGARAVVKADGLQALEEFCTAPQGTYDGILMDIQMPEMNGYETTRAIRALDRPDAGRIPIIAMTANAFDEDVKAAMEAGMNGHVAKPVDMEILRAMLCKFISASNVQAEQP